MKIGPPYSFHISFKIWINLSILKISIYIYFPPTFVLSKLTCLVTLFDLKLIFKNQHKMDHFWWTFVHSRYKSFVRKVDLMCKKSYLKAIEKFGVKTRKVLPLHVFLKLQEKSHSTIQHCERSELCLHCGWTKVHWKCKKIVNLASIWKPIACGQTMLPDKSIFIGQKLAKNATNTTFWVIFKHCKPF